MPKTRAPYPAEFRLQIIELAQAGRHPAELSREFGPTSQRFINWVARAARDACRPLPGDDGEATQNVRSRVGCEKIASSGWR